MYKNKNYNNANNGNNQNQQRTKKSGATFTVCKEKVNGHEGMISVNAWVSTKAGLVKLHALGYETVKGKKSGKLFQKCVVEVTNAASGQTSKYPALINVEKKVVAVNQIGWLITSNGFGVTSSGKKVRGAVVQLQK